MLELGVDELSIVLQIEPSTIKSYGDDFDWSDVAEKIICRFVEKADFKNVFGDCISEMRAPQGYTTAYTFGEHSFYLAVGYNEDYLSLGVIIKFSGQSLDFYYERSGLKVYEFLQNIRDRLYTVRLSRIDLTADYIDENINVTKICQDLIDNKVGIFREYTSKKNGELAYKRSIMKVQGFLKEREIPTIYIGSAQSNSQLRIYDKKREQIERNGSKLDKAKKSKNWVRFEGVFRGEYAHQLSDELMNINNDDEYANLIACTMIQKFRFKYIDRGVIAGEAEYSEMLLDCIINEYYILKAPSSKNYDIAKSIKYMFYGSGVLNTMYKIKSIWGDKAVSELFTLVNGYLVDWEPNADCHYWIRKNRDDYIINYPDFDMLLEEYGLTES